MTEFLIPQNHNAGQYHHDPYQRDGAISILGRFRAEMVDMFIHMEMNEQMFDAGKTFLAKSPLRSRPYVAAAMKTMGMVRETPSANGSCALVLTDRGRTQIPKAHEMQRVLSRKDKVV